MPAAEAAPSGAGCKTQFRTASNRSTSDAKRDAVLLNAAAALFVAGRTRTMIEGWDLAAETIDGGKARAKLAELQR